MDKGLEKIFGEMTEDCPEKDDHEWVGHGDPGYMWCLYCQQEKPTNKEFIAYFSKFNAVSIVTRKDRYEKL